MVTMIMVTIAMVVKGNLEMPIRIVASLILKHPPPPL